MIAAAHRPGPVAVTGIAFVMLAVAAATTLAARLPVSLWWSAAFAPDEADVRQILVHYSLLPRLVTALVAGAALGLSGALLQQVLRNPLASPTTLGIEAGARLALGLAVLGAPDLIAGGRELVALAGAGIGIGIVLLLTARRGFAPVEVVLAGLLVGLYAGSVAATLSLVHEQWLVSLFVWGGGSLAQQDWSIAAALAPRAAAAAVAAALLVRPLAVLELGDEAARAVGLPVAAIRLTALAVAVALAASVVAAVGVIAFVGLVAPALAALLGARGIAARLALAAAVGALLLTATDLLVQQTSGFAGELLPTGAVTAVFGAPMLVVLLVRRGALAGPPTAATAPAGRRAGRPAVVLAIAALVLMALAAGAMVLGPDADGWRLATADLLARLAPWRWPRVVAALSCGALLAAAGCLLQRLTANPMAAPEMVGVSAGAGAGLLVAVLCLDEPGRLAVLAAATAGAVAVLAVVLAVAGRGRLPPERLLVCGLAIGALFDAAVGVLMASADPRAMMLFAWSTGSTYTADVGAALAVALAAVVLLPLLPLASRWLAALPLGATTAAAVGVPVTRARLVLLGLTALLTAAATLVIGPVSFVGLMAPHIARGLGLASPGAELAGSVAVGAAVMVAADWVGRTLLFPFEIPAGLAATLVGGPWLVWLLARRR